MVFSIVYAISQEASTAEALKKAGYTHVDLKKDTYNRFVVNAMLDGKKFKLIIDNSFPETFLDKNTLERHSIEVEETGQDWEVNGDSDDMYVTTIKEIKVGEGTLGEQDIMAVDFEEFDYLEDVRADGFLGSDFLVRYECLIDLANQKMYIKNK